jgi:nicotinamide N-methyltransferase
MWLVAASAGATTNFTPAKTHTRHDLPFVMSSEADEESIDLFQEPADFYEPEKEATFATHTLLNGKELIVRLVGHNPLWVRFLPNRVIACNRIEPFSSLFLLLSSPLLLLSVQAGLYKIAGQT